MMAFVYLLFVVLTFSTLHGSQNPYPQSLKGIFQEYKDHPLNRHLKKIDALDKIGYQGIKNVDFIYMINLDRRPEKLKQSFDQLALYNIVPFRFSAVNGKDKPLKEIAELGVTYTPDMAPNVNIPMHTPGGVWGTYYSEQDGPHHELIATPNRNYFYYPLGKGELGCLLSHLSILKDAYDAGYNTIWVMEDDIQVIQNPHLISSLIKKLNGLVGKNSWDILFTDQDTKDKNGNYVICRSYAPRPNFSPADPERFARTQEVGSKFRKVGARYGAYSIIINRCGIKKLLDFFYRYG